MRVQNVTAEAPERHRPMTVLPIDVTGDLRYLGVMTRAMTTCHTARYGTGIRAAVMAAVQWRMTRPDMRVGVLGAVSWIVAGAMPGGMQAAGAYVSGMAFGSCRSPGQCQTLINRTAGQNVNDGRRCRGGPVHDGVTAWVSAMLSVTGLDPRRRHGRRRPAAARVQRCGDSTSATVTWPRRDPRLSGRDRPLSCLGCVTRRMACPRH